MESARQNVSISYVKSDRDCVTDGKKGQATAAGVMMVFIECSMRLSTAGLHKIVDKEGEMRA